MAHLFPTSLRLPAFRAAGLPAGTNPRWAQAVSTLVWAGLAATAVYWGLKLWGGAQPVPPGAVVVTDGTAKGDPQRLFAMARSTSAAEPMVATAASSRFKLLGVVAPVPTARSAGDVSSGVAMMSVDGGPARSYRVGAALGDNLIVQAITQQGVQIGPAGGAATVSLSLPVLQAAARGVPGPSNGLGNTTPTNAPLSALQVPPPQVAQTMAYPNAPTQIPGAEGQPIMIEPPSAGPAGRLRSKLEPLAAAASAGASAAR